MLLSRRSASPARPTLRANSRSELVRVLGRGEIFVPTHRGGISGVMHGRALDFLSTTKIGYQSGRAGWQGSLNTGEGACINSSNYGTNGWGGLTAIFLAYCDGAWPSGGVICRETSATSTGIDIEMSGTNTMRCLIASSGTSFWSAGGEAALTATQGWYLIGMTWDGATRKMWQAPLGGSFSNVGTNQTVTGAIVISDLSNAKLVVGGGLHSSNTGYDQPISLAYLADRDIGLDRLNSLARDPWQLFKTAEIVIFPAVAGAAAALAGDATGQATAAGQITTQIPLAGASVVVATASGAINVPINLSADAMAVSSATASLTTGIPLVDDAVGNASAAADLSTGIQLEGSAVGQSTATADLMATITLFGNVVAQALASAGIDTSIILGGNAAGQSTATGDLGGGAAQLAGNANASATATGNLTIQIQLAADAVAQAIATGSLDAPVNLDGGASGQSAAAGDLTTQIQMDGAATGQSTATGQLVSSDVPLAGDATATATGAGDLDTQIQFESVALNVVSGTGSLTVNLAISGNAAALVTAGADLTTQIPLNAAAVAQALATANLSGGVSTIQPSPQYTTIGAWRDYQVTDRRDYRVAA